MKEGHYLKSYTKISSQCLEDVPSRRKCRTFWSPQWSFSSSFTSILMHFCSCSYIHIIYTSSQDLNLWPNTLKWLEEKWGHSLAHRRRQKCFGKKNPKAKIDKRDHVKLRSFYTLNDTISKVKRQQQNGTKYLQIMQLK